MIFILVYEVTSGAKMNPTAVCTKTMEDLLKWEPELILMSSPNAALKGPKACREMAGDIPTIIISDAPAKKAIDEIKEKNMGYVPNGEIIKGYCTISEFVKCPDKNQITIFLQISAVNQIISYPNDKQECTNQRNIPTKLWQFFRYSY